MDESGPLCDQHPPPTGPPSPCALIATKFDTSCSRIFSLKFRCLMVDRHAWLTDCLPSVSANLTLSCSYRSHLCPSLSVRQIWWHFMLSNTFSGVSSFDGDSCPLARLIGSVRFPQNSTPHPSNFCSELGSLMEPTRIFCTLIGGRWKFNAFLPISRLWRRPRMIRCSCK